jgi:hypothetical protein
MKQIAQIIALILPGPNTIQVLVLLTVVILIFRQLLSKRAENTKMVFERKRNSDFDSDMWAIE